MKYPDFGRVITAMITPFDDDLNIDHPRVIEFCERLINDGSDSLIVCGTTGESPTLSVSEKLELFDSVIKGVADRIPVIANVGSNATHATIDLIKEAEKRNIDGFMCVVPYYNKPPKEGLYQHFHAIASSTDLPIILYNIPGRCVINMNADTILRLVHDHSNIVAVKEASGDIEQVKAVIANAPEHFVVYSGDDSFTLPIMREGGKGVISTTSNLCGRRMQEIVQAAAQGEWERAEEYNRSLMPLMEGLFATTNPILVKEGLKLDGFAVGGVRLPLIEATKEQSETLHKIMQQVQII